MHAVKDVKQEDQVKLINIKQKTKTVNHKYKIPKKVSASLDSQSKHAVAMTCKVLVELV